MHFMEKNTEEFEKKIPVIIEVHVFDIMYFIKISKFQTPL